MIFPDRYRILILCAALSTCVANTASAEGAGAPFGTPQPDLLGEHVIRSAASGDVIGRSRIEMSSSGFRASNTLDGRLAIVNFALQRRWFVDRARRLVHEVPVSINSKLPGPGMASASGGARIRAGVFSSEPCYPLLVGESTPTTWRGRPVRLVDCLDEEDRFMGLHYFSDELGMVVRSEDERDVVEEIHDIVRSPIDDTRFLPPESYRQVDLATFTGSRPPLGSYLENAARLSTGKSGTSPRRGELRNDRLSIDGLGTV